MTEKTKGKCKFCGKIFASAFMGRHLAACDARKKYFAEEESRGTEPCGYYLIRVADRYRKEYWMYIEVDADLTLFDLDFFLRDIWVGCCEHISGFVINGNRYDYGPFTDIDTMWDCVLKTVLHPGTRFRYKFDFGSPTELDLTVEAYREGHAREEKITVLSRNIAPSIPCGRCGKERATTVLLGYEGDSDAFLCDTCFKAMDVEEGLYVPICNSPRTGYCVYTGSDHYPDEFVPDTELTQ